MVLILIRQKSLKPLIIKEFESYENVPRNDNDFTLHI